MQGAVGAGPVRAGDRIASIDTLRGVALLGILILNIVAFGLVSSAFSNPIPDGALTGVNFWTYVSVDVLFEKISWFVSDEFVRDELDRFGSVWIETSDDIFDHFGEELIRIL